MPTGATASLAADQAGNARYLGAARVAPGHAVVHEGGCGALAPARLGLVVEPRVLVAGTVVRRVAWLRPLFGLPGGRGRVPKTMPACSPAPMPPASSP